MKNMEENQVNRDETGNQIKPGPLKGSYAEYRLEKLKEWRKMYNVDELGNYKGGVPRPGQGANRGNAIGISGAFHNPWLHNQEVHDNPSAHNLGLEEAQEHKNYMQSNLNKITL